MRITGAVLCGGASSRMGRDKATMDLRGRPMAQWVVDAMKDAGATTVVALGDRPDLELPVLVDREPGSGPLGARPKRATTVSIISSQRPTTVPTRPSWCLSQSI